MKHIEVVFINKPELKNISVTVSASERDEQTEYLLDLIRNSGGNDLYVLDSNGNLRRIIEDRIIRIKAAGRILSVLTDEGEFRLRRTMQEAENMLHSNMFLKISRFEIINLRKVQKFDFTIAGQLRIEFEDGSVTWASRRYITLIKQRLSERKAEL